MMVNYFYFAAFGRGISLIEYNELVEYTLNGSAEIHFPYCYTNNSTIKKYKSCRIIEIKINKFL